MDAFLARFTAPSGALEGSEAPGRTTQGQIGSGGATQPESQKKKRQPAADGSQQVAVVSEPDERKRRRRSGGVKPSSKARKFAQEQVFKDQSLVLVDGDYLYCSACRKRINCSKRKYVNQHCFGQGRDAKSWSTLSPKERQSCGHYRNLLALQEEERKKTLLQKAVEEQRKQVFQQFEGKAQVVGATLPSDSVAKRANILLALWRNGIPLSSLDDADFRRLVEEQHDSIGGREGVRRLIPVANSFLQDEIREAVCGRHLSIFFDGSKVNESIEAVVVRVLKDDFSISHLCIGASMVTLNLSSNTLLQAVRKHLEAADIKDEQIVCATTDSAAVNVAMVKLWNESAATFYGSELDHRKLMWIGCLAHGLSNCGTAMRKSAKLLKKFFSAFKKMSNTSHAARRVWKEITGVACPVICDNRWWCWYDCAAAVYSQWDKVPQFLRLLSNREISIKCTQKMVDILNGSSNAWLSLELQIRVCLAFGKQFRDACALLEGDGFVLPYISGTLRQIRDLVRTMSVQRENHPLFADLRQRCHEFGLYQGAIDQALSYLVPIVMAGMDKFRLSIWEKAGDLFPLYDAGSLFHPLVLLDQCEKEAFGDDFVKHCEEYARIKGLPRESSKFRFQLIAELEIFKNAARKLKLEIATNPTGHSPLSLWQWWISQRLILPAWFDIACKLVLIMPSSATVERFFSIVKAQTSAQQNAEYADTFAGRCKALFNK